MQDSFRQASDSQLSKTKLRTQQVFQPNGRPTSRHGGATTTVDAIGCAVKTSIHGRLPYLTGMIRPAANRGRFTIAGFEKDSVSLRKFFCARGNVGGKGPMAIPAAEKNPSYCDSLFCMICVPHNLPKSAARARIGELLGCHLRGWPAAYPKSMAGRLAETTSYEKVGCSGPDPPPTSSPRSLPASSTGPGNRN